jgi:uncharacterized protein YegP (UPF0339 family)
MAKAKRRGQIEIYRDESNEIRVRIRASNGQIVPDGYVRRRGVDRAIEIFKDLANWPVVDVTHQTRAKAPKKDAPATTPAPAKAAAE